MPNGMTQEQMLETKQCNKCGKTKNIDAFYKDSRVKNRLRPTCKECLSQLTYPYRQKNKKRKQEYDFIYREENRHRLNAYQWEYYQKNKQHILKRAKTWQKANPEAIKKYKQKRGTKRNAVSMIIYKACKSGKLERPNYCSRCGEIKKISAHHENYDRPLDVIWLCQACHSKLHRRSA